MKAKNALLISVRPKFANMIFSGRKTVELRRVKPRIQSGDLVFLYESSPTKALRGALEVAAVIHASIEVLWRTVGSKSGLTHGEFQEYFSGKTHGFAIAIKNKWSLSVPMSLSRLRKRQTGFLAPQSYHYVCKHQFARVAGLTRTLERLLA